MTFMPPDEPVDGTVAHLHLLLACFRASPPPTQLPLEGMGESLLVNVRRGRRRFVMPRRGGPGGPAFGLLAPKPPHSVLESKSGSRFLLAALFHGL